MEHRDRKSKRSVKRRPLVPIETYEWEEIRRARARGGYPWTYLYKGEYEGQIDPGQFTMDALRKTRSSSNVDKSGVQIEEITNGTNEKIKDVKEIEKDKAKDDHSIPRTPEPTVTQYDSTAEEAESVGDRDRPEIIALESAESSDNISQYLDKEYKLASNANLPEAANIPGTSEEVKHKETLKTSKQDERAKSEEPKRKRRLSIESSYSRISLSKLGVIKKLKQAKEKMRRLSVSTSNLHQKKSKKVKQEEEKEAKREMTLDELIARMPPVKSPVYIHIPLKPPPGQVDKFSDLESGDKKEDKVIKPKFSFKSLGTRVIQESKSSENLPTSQIQLNGNAEKAASTSDIATENLGGDKLLTPAKSSDNFSQKTDDQEEKKSVSRSGSQKSKSGEHKPEENIVVTKTEVTVAKTIERTKPSKKTSKLKERVERVTTLESVKKTSSSTESDEPVTTDVFIFDVAGTSKQPEDIAKIRAKSAEPERKRKRSVDSAYSRISMSKLGFLKKIKDRADKIKIPKLSLSRSNSQKEKQKDKEKVKDKVKTKEKGKEKEKGKKETKTITDASVKDTKGKDVKPVYIHIPLKPPPGETDEFSYLEFGDKQEVKEAEKESSETPESPKSIESQGNAVQFIILTAPSDDEILDDHSPDTPSSDDVKPLFDDKEKQKLKELAEKAVDKVSPESKRKNLDTVSENSENGSTNVKPEETLEVSKESEANDTGTKNVEDNKDEKTSKSGEDGAKTENANQKAEEKIEEATQEPLAAEEAVKNKNEKSPVSEKSAKKSDESNKDVKPDTPAEKQRIIVDEEDGLKSSEIIQEEGEENNSKEKELKSVLKSEAEGSPILKKKVSFKRRSKSDTKEDSYEEMEAKPGSEEGKNEKVSILGASQSMSVDEEKSYMDQKIIKDTSLEDDYNKWSKLSDHDYEPINPPPDDVVLNATIHINDKDQKHHPPLSRSSFDNRMTGDELSDEEIISAHEMQQQLEDRFFKSSPSPKPTETTSSRPESTSPENTRTRTASTSSERAAKLQQAFKTQTDKFKTKLHNMKKPNIKLPSRPKFQKPNMQKFKIERPKINFPKMPEAPKINLPSFSLPRRSKQSLKQRQFSTESNAGGSKRKFFDFRTYPRIFKKKQPDDFDSSSAKVEPEFATVPRTSKNDKKDSRKSKETDRWGGRDIIRIPLHSEESMDLGEDREDSVERRMASHTRYDEDIDDIDDAYQKENQEIHKASPFSNNYNSRWNHGSFHPDPNRDVAEDLEMQQEQQQQEYRNNDDFVNEEYLDEQNNIKNLDLSNRGLRIEEFYDDHNRDYKVTDLDSPDDVVRSQNESFDTNTSKDVHSSESSLGVHRRGVLEEINPDEFFLRQKGISQDNIDVGKYLSSEIREAFRTDINALTQMEYNDELRASNQSLPEAGSRKKSVKKPKRRKTPHASQERLKYEDEEESDTEIPPEIPPCRPKRRSKRGRKSQPKEEIIPYQETIPVRDATPIEGHIRNEQLKDFGILSRSDDEQDMHFKTYYENEHMEGKDQPVIQVTDPYKNLQYESRQRKHPVEPPAPPPRRYKSKSRSLKSLTLSEHDSIMGNFERESDIPLAGVEVYKTEHEYIIPIPTSDMGPLMDQFGRKEIEEEIRAKEHPVRPFRMRSRTRSQSRTTSHTEDDQISREAESILSSETPELCVEEPCIRTLCDYMGYAIVDKSKCRDPPLPPPRTTPRKKRGAKSDDPAKFSTVPRSSTETPVRPLRNYSTLGPPASPKPTSNLTDEEKENIDISQYIEIDEEPVRRLQSGEVIQKMRERPLPAPPRPPRKSRPLRDITSQENIASSCARQEQDKENLFDETEVSTQTEPLPDDFICEEVVQEATDRVITPSRRQRQDKYKAEETPEHVQRRVERRLITPSRYSYEEETVTHGSLVVEPLNGAQILPEHQLTRSERVVPVTVDDDETSEIPEDFRKLRDPTPRERGSERPSSVVSEVELLKTQKLQVSDLDIDRLTVNELLANKIIVSEIDSGNIQVNEISSKSGALKVGEIELPPNVVQQILERLQSVAQERMLSSLPKEEKPQSSEEPPLSQQPEDSADPGQKKTSIEQKLDRTGESKFQEPQQEIPGDFSIKGPVVTEEISDEQCSQTDEQSDLSPPVIPSPIETDETRVSSFQDYQGPDPKSPRLPSSIPSEESTLFLPEIELEIEEQIIPIDAQLVEITPNLLDPPIILFSSEYSPENSVKLDHNLESPQETPCRPLRQSEITKLEDISKTCEEITKEPDDDLVSQTSDRPPQPPPRSLDSSTVPDTAPPVFAEQETEHQKPQRPPRQSDKLRGGSRSRESTKPPEDEPEVDDEPPPRPPQPDLGYFPSQPPPSFYALRAQKFVEAIDDNDIPVTSRLFRQRRPPASGSSSDGEGPSSAPVRRRFRSPEPSIPQLTGQLIGACSIEATRQIKRLISHIRDNVLGNADGKQDMHVLMIILLVLIAGLLLLTSNDGKTIHYHHWEYFNPPRDM